MGLRGWAEDEVGLKGWTGWTGWTSLDFQDVDGMWTGCGQAKASLGEIPKSNKMLSMEKDVGSETCFSFIVTLFRKSLDFI